MYVERQLKTAAAVALLACGFAVASQPASAAAADYAALNAAIVDDYVLPRYAAFADTTVVLEGDPDETFALRPGEAFVVPRGRWHRIEVIEPGDMVFVTEGDGTEHKPL